MGYYQVSPWPLALLREPATAVLAHPSACRGFSKDVRVILEVNLRFGGSLDDDFFSFLHHL